MGRHFTLEEAERLLPRVEEDLRQAMTLRAEYGKAEAEIESILRRVALLGGSVVNHQHVVRLQSRREALGARLKEVIQGIHEYGCLVKDLEIGLIDFPTLFRGEEVYLCWRMGEEGIQFWHRVEEGYRGRKKIDADFLIHHRGDPAH